MFLAAVLAILIAIALAMVRAFRGPSAYDSLLAANLVGTKTVLLIAIGGYVLAWPAFLDIALLYALVNFVNTVAVMRFFECYGSGSKSGRQGEV